jgi:hypothetical protein
MKLLMENIEDIENNGEETTQEEAQQRPVPDFEVSH